ncbi:magnesium transporter MRS2-3 [Vigna radiata var. radiata]|uniref:Magnesium transporter n=1 Tax=Vigna radiata var. radiata TaxID=3916 RepID=A0A1S3VSE4_VIGRR|nr:magnesium transporter MRS2-3 [Vigna radiata var. radiata]
MRGGEERQTATGIRKKGSGVRQWLMLDGKGETEVVEAGKHAIMRRTGLPARDLRILDPLLSYPSTLLGRERAIVINLEHIKAIITAHEVLLLNSRDPSVTPFVQELQARILRHHQACSKHHDHHTDSDPDHDHDPDAIKILPFEFVALEACLEAACSVLENEAKTLEQEAHPALDKLTSKISTLNLERVRQIKSRLVAITGRVQKVRDELEHLLDDDDDMAEMYLTEKLAEQQMEESSSASSINDHDQQDIDDRTTTEISFEAVTPPVGFEDQHNAYNVLGRDSHGTRGSTYSAVTKQLDVEELEMLLEAYFVQIDGTLNKLSTLREYVDDTEDYINIMLDDKQNHLLQMGVMLTTATLVVSAFVVVAGVFGMNIHIELFDPDKAGMTEFLWTVGGSTAGTIFLYVVAIAWCKQKRLLE